TAACQTTPFDIFCEIYRSIEVCRVRFDAQCDVAAIVYGADDDPDRLLISFADDLHRAGGRPIGVVQAGRSCQAEDRRLGVVFLPSGEKVCLVPPVEGRPGGCGLDAGRLAQLAKRLAAALQDGADLVVVNRFGRAEAEGRGLIDLIAQALDSDIPLL